MNDFYTYLKGEKATVAMDDKVGCELCPNDKVGKAGECKFEKGAEPEPGTGKDVAPIVGAAIGAAASGAAEGAGNLMSAANGDKKPKCCVKDALAEFLGEGQEKKPNMKTIEDSSPFKEDDHPRESKGGEGGGRFKTSSKTIAKQDDLDQGKGDEEKKKGKKDGAFVEWQKEHLKEGSITAPEMDVADAKRILVDELLGPDFLIGYPCNGKQEMTEIVAALIEKYKKPWYKKLWK